MITIKALINHFRGWLPKEPSFLSTATVQVPQKTTRHNLAMVYLTIFAAVFATVFITLGILEVLSLGSYSSYIAGAAAAVAAAITSVLIIKRNQTSNIDERRTKP